MSFDAFIRQIALLDLWCNVACDNVDHILILEQEFQCRAINVISLGLLASKFKAESKNVNLFAGERLEFFGQKTKGGTLTVENFQ